MNSRISGILAVVAGLAMSGCATMSSEECALSDWSAVGYEDGARGYSTERFSSHRKACAKHGITADFWAYQEGRDEGLVEFCQPSRGYNLGVSGSSYNGVCDVALEEEFLDAYRVGHQLYSLRSNVNSANYRIASNEREIDRIEDDVRASEVRLIADDTSIEDRILLLADLKRLSERKGELEAEIDQLVRDLARHEHELTDYENTVAAYGF
ncbi:MAG: DUF2799 domain-containing protein [Proteobacteria bacterium]|nr:DUF2799 domain-containing protein [Pseudomonadota bacterium]